MMHEYYIDGETGKDSNPGTIDKPMKTIIGVANKIEVHKQEQTAHTEVDTGRQAPRNGRRGQ